MRMLSKSLAAALCCVAATTAAARADQLTGAGSTFAFPLLSKWSDAFHKLEAGLTINYQSIGSGAGVQQLKVGTVDFGASDAPLSNEERTEMPGPVLHIPMAAGADVLGYNLPGVPSGLKLTSDVIADIYLGKIKKWNDPRITGLNPRVNLPSRAIIVVHRSDGSGTTYIFTSYLSSVNAEWKRKVGTGKSVQWPVGLGGKGNEGVAGGIKQAPGGLGYIELAYANESHIAFATVRNKAGNWVAPSLESITAAAEGGAAALKTDIRESITNSPSPKAYAISGFTYMLVYRDQKDPKVARDLVRFIQFGMHQGQPLAASLAYAPLPKSVVALNEAAIRTMTAQGKKISPK